MSSQKQSNDQIQIPSTNPYNQYEINLNGLDEYEVIDEYDEENEDYSNTAIKKNEELQIKLETGVIPSKKYHFQIGKTKSNYKVILYSNSEALNKSIQEILYSIPLYEKLNKEKLFKIAVTDRKEVKNNPFVLNKDLSTNYNMLLPDGEIVPLFIMTQEKGKSNRYYHKFRLLMHKYKNAINKIEFTDDELEHLKNEILGEFIYYYLSKIYEIENKIKFDENADLLKFDNFFNMFFENIFEKNFDEDDYDYNNIEKILKDNAYKIYLVFEEYRNYFLKLGDIK